MHRFHIGIVLVLKVRFICANALFMVTLLFKVCVWVYCVWVKDKGFQASKQKFNTISFIFMHLNVMSDRRNNGTISEIINFYHDLQNKIS